MNFIVLIITFFSLAIFLCCSDIATATTFNSKFEDLRNQADPSSIQRAGSLETIIPTKTENDDDEQLSFCPIAVFLPYTRMNDEGVRIPYPSRSYLQSAQSVHLALKHLNEGDGSIIPEVWGLNERCNIRFTAEIFDTEASESVAVEKTIQVLQEGRDKYPCYILGAARSAVSIPMSIVTSLMGVVQISPISTSPILDADETPLFGRLVPSDDGGAILTARYFCNELKGTHLGIIHSNDSYGNAFRTALIKAASDHCDDLTTISVDVSVGGPDAQAEMARAVEILKEGQMKHFFGIIDGKDDYILLMEEACRQGIAGTGEHLWMFSDSISSSTIPSLEVEPGSCLHRASIGTAMIAPRGGLPGKPVYDEFIRQWQDLNNPEDVEFIESRLPKYPDEQDYTPPKLDESIFASIGTTPLYSYDETIAMGLAACDVASRGMKVDSSTLYQGFLDSSFQGVTGQISVNEVGSRDPDSAYFVVLNYQERVIPESGLITFEPVVTDIYEDRAWNRMEPYIFADNTTNIPPSLPELTVDHKYIGTTLRIVGLVMCAINLLLSLGLAIWTYGHRTTKVVVASQPIFLYIICAGTFLMGSTIIPLSIDDEHSSEDGCTIACAVSPWLFAFGFTLAFAALFSKTWRVNRIFHNAQMRRIRISVLDVMTPLIVLIVLNVIVLSVWTAVEPLEWVRTVVTFDIFGRPTESLGKCSFDGALPFIIVLALIDIGALIFAMWQAYLARNISTEFAESKYIAYAMAAVLLVCFEGIPILVIASEDTRARFFALSCIISVVCAAILLFIFVPKIRFVRKKKSMRSAIRSSIAPASTARLANQNSFVHSNMSISRIDEDRSRTFSRFSSYNNKQNNSPQSSKTSIHDDLEVGGVGMHRNISAARQSWLQNEQQHQGRNLSESSINNDLSYNATDESYIESMQRSGSSVVAHHKGQEDPLQDKVNMLEQKIMSLENHIKKVELSSLSETTAQSPTTTNKQPTGVSQGEEPNENLVEKVDNKPTEGSSSDKEILTNPQSTEVSREGTIDTTTSTEV